MPTITDDDVRFSSLYKTQFTQITTKSGKPLTPAWNYVMSNCTFSLWHSCTWKRDGFHWTCSQNPLGLFTEQFSTASYVNHHKGICTSRILSMVSETYWHQQAICIFLVHSLQPLGWRIRNLTPSLTYVLAEVSVFQPVGWRQCIRALFILGED